MVEVDRTCVLVRNKTGSQNVWIRLQKGKEKRATQDKADEYDLGRYAEVGPEQTGAAGMLLPYVPGGIVGSKVLLSSVGSSAIFCLLMTAVSHTEYA